MSKNPHVANFERGGKYGDLALPRGSYVENILVTGGSDTTLDIALEKPPDKPAASAPAVNRPIHLPTGFAGGGTIDDPEASG